MCKIIPNCCMVSSSLNILFIRSKTHHMLSTRKSYKNIYKTKILRTSNTIWLLYTHRRSYKRAKCDICYIIIRWAMLLLLMGTHIINTEKGFFKYKKYIKSNINIIPIATWRYLYFVCVFFFFLLCCLEWWKFISLCISHLRNVHM